MDAISSSYITQLAYQELNSQLSKDQQNQAEEAQRDQAIVNGNVPN